MKPYLFISIKDTAVNQGRSGKENSSPQNESISGKKGSQNFLFIPKTSTVNNSNDIHDISEGTLLIYSNFKIKLCIYMIICIFQPTSGSIFVTKSHSGQCGFITDKFSCIPLPETKTVCNSDMTIGDTMISYEEERAHKSKLKLTNHYLQQKSASILSEQEDLDIIAIDPLTKKSSSQRKRSTCDLSLDENMNDDAPTSKRRRKLDKERYSYKIWKKYIVIVTFFSRNAELITATYINDKFKLLLIVYLNSVVRRNVRKDLAEISRFNDLSDAFER
uniref:Uncharacterized protein n=1 Tax=Heterorhabditis bacteriophora TaxID=37862 RepID=A0A1I7XC01_HETBA